MRNKRVQWVLLSMLFLAFAVAASAAETRMEKTSPGGSKVVVTFAGAPLKTMTETPFKIELTGPSDKVIEDARFNISLDMPAMPMPPNHPKVTWKGDAYHGVAVFTMAGAWQVFVNIQRPGYDQEQVVFDIEEVLMK